MNINISQHKFFARSILIVAIILFAMCGGVLADEISYGKVLFDIGIIKGDGTGLNEEGILNREEMVTILNRLGFDKLERNEFTPPENESFTDLPPDHWAYRNVEFAVKNKITQGIGEGKFGVGLKINGNQAALFLARIIGFDTDNFNGEKIEYEEAYKIISSELKIYSNEITEPSQAIKRSAIFEMVYRALQVKSPKIQTN